jgi:hypothetical protein
MNGSRSPESFSISVFDVPRPGCARDLHASFFQCRSSACKNSVDYGESYSNESYLRAAVYGGVCAVRFDAGLGISSFRELTRICQRVSSEHLSDVCYCEGVE